MRVPLPTWQYVLRAALIYLAAAVFVILVVALAIATHALAHDKWSNGDKVPDWVKKSCCGAHDMHHLTPDMVHRISDDFYEVDGYQGKIPVRSVLPSQDGDYWIFYACPSPQCTVYCFFIPLSF